MSLRHRMQVSIERPYWHFNGACYWSGLCRHVLNHRSITVYSGLTLAMLAFYIIVNPVIRSSRNDNSGCGSNQLDPRGTYRAINESFCRCWRYTCDGRMNSEPGKKGEKLTLVMMSFVCLYTTPNGEVCSNLATKHYSKTHKTRLLLGFAVHAPVLRIRALRCWLRPGMRMRVRVKRHASLRLTCVGDRPLRSLRGSLGLTLVTLWRFVVCTRRG
ncbi:hypothetical protein F5J12DRAFT_494855 [Pisolithus orientalis]|uniref:uncharacterized protein n=1 Tax=Pisolithus orientalis TaxID=936130 RepID=UPI0022249620|nr:uncharacterized protein F5J12DRAFT_494855 [Pisolithus orientalis]KAI6019922.1 hypothetical protein F5J12DRAFT_494855 [Pisolithus orientalis]